jgi:hypothetical protein
MDDLGVLSSMEPTVARWRHVQIDEARLAAVCAEIAPGQLQLPQWDMLPFMRAAPDALAGQILLFNTVNCCYWGDPKWQIEYQGQVWDGSMAMLTALRRALDEGRPILDGAYLAQLTIAEFEDILRGRGRLHLMGERLAIWHAVGVTMVNEFGGRWTNVIAAAGGDAVALAALLVDRFPSFDDTWLLDGAPVRFYKRAQLAASMLFEAFAGQDWGALRRAERLTVFADYKVPQVLRRLGILVYDAALAATVDGQTLIPAGDRREVEIRAATVWAVELMRRTLAPRLPEVSAMHLDYWLWDAGRQQGPDIRPYHRTLTTAY